MKRAFYLVSSIVIVTSFVLLVGAWWTDLRNADARATEYIRAHHPSIAAAAKNLGDKFRGSR